MAMAPTRLRWILAGLYAAVVLGLLGLGYGGFGPDWMGLSWLEDELVLVLFLLGIMVVSQAFFLLSAGTVNLCRPIRRPRLVAPVLISGGLATLLLFGAAMALAELFEVGGPHWPEAVFWGITVVIWLVWALVFYLAVRDKQRFPALRFLVVGIITGSLLELLLAVPAHLIVTRRPGCFVGMGTSVALSCGVLVALWVFGPGIVLLFLRHRYETDARSSGEEILR